MKFCVFGSSSKATDQVYLDAAYELGQLIASEGHICTNGGGKFGVMGSLSGGVRSKNGYVIGIIHEKLYVDGEEDKHTSEMIISHGPDLTERKQLLYDNGDCIIVLPGGVGTFDELWECVSSKSLNMKGLGGKPICVVSINGYYDGSIQQINRAYRDKLLYLPVEKYFHVVTTVTEAYEWCIKTYKATNGKEIEDISLSRKSIKDGRTPSTDLPTSGKRKDDPLPNKMITSSFSISSPFILSNGGLFQSILCVSIGIAVGFSMGKFLK